MAKLGLDYESLRKVNPALVYCSITGYGQEGPLSARAGHDINYLARSGIMSYSGKKESGPSLTGMQIADIASGSYNAIIGILAAVISRNATERGQHVDISMTDGAIAFNALVGGAYLVDGKEFGREEFFLNGGSLYDFYETKDGKYLSFGGLEPQFFSAFCETIGRPDLISGGVMPPNVESVKEEVRAILRTKSRDEWMDSFNRTDACVEPVLTLSEALDDPHVEKRNLVIEQHLPWGGTVRQIANPIRFSGTPQVYRGPGDQPGTHTKEVLRDLGYRNDEIETFEKEGVFN